MKRGHSKAGMHIFSKNVGAVQYCRHQMVDVSKFHAEDLQILGTIYKSLLPVEPHTQIIPELWYMLTAVTSFVTT